LQVATNFSPQITAWLRASGYTDLASHAEAIIKEFSDRKDVGLEIFLRFINNTLEETRITVEPGRLRLSNLLPGFTYTYTLSVTNTGRGHFFGSVDIVPPIPGLKVEPHQVEANNLLGITSSLNLNIDTSMAVSGRTNVNIRSYSGSCYSVPVSFTCVAISKALRHPDPGVVSAATRTAGNLRERSVVAILSDLVAIGNQEVRLAAINALGQIGDTSAIKVLNIACPSHECAIRSAVRDAFQIR